MEKTIFVEPLQKYFKVSIKEANKQKRNRSFSNASDCCGVVLKQEKFCSGCNEKITETPSRKIIKIGKQEHLIDAQALKQVQEQLESCEDIKIHTFLNKLPSNAVDRFESLVYTYPAVKKEAQYKELTEILKNRFAIGTGVFRNNEFQVILSVGNDGILRIRKLVEESQRYDFDSEEVVASFINTEVNPQVLEIENSILDKQMKDDFDLTSFKDMRTAYEEQIIEDFVINGKIPEIKTKVAEQQAVDELERLKALNV